jgi:hypothetical protein
MYPFLLIIIAFTSIVPHIAMNGIFRDVESGDASVWGDSEATDEVSFIITSTPMLSIHST